MKKILFVLCFCFFAKTNAQQIQVEENPPNWSVMLSNLNQSQITAGFLYNKTAMFINFNN
jgi:hypothetical protein